MPGSHDIGSITNLSPSPPLCLSEVQNTEQERQRAWAPADYMRCGNL